jgi:hypothetical protein
MLAISNDTRIKRIIDKDTMVRDSYWKWYKHSTFFSYNLHPFLYYNHDSFLFFRVTTMSSYNFHTCLFTHSRSYSHTLWTYAIIDVLQTSSRQTSVTKHAVNYPANTFFGRLLGETLALFTLVVDGDVNLIATFRVLGNILDQRQLVVTCFDPSVLI